MNSKEELLNHVSTPAAAGGIARLFAGYGPMITLAPDTGAGSGGDAADESAKDEADNGDTDVGDDGADKAEDTADAEDENKGDDHQEETPGDNKDKGVSDETAKLLRENMKRKQAIKDLEKQLEAFKGVDPEKYRQMIQAQQDAEQASLEAKGDFERVKQMMVEKQEQVLAEKDAVIADLQAKLAGSGATINDLTIGSNFNSSKFVTEDLVLTPAKARVVYGSHFGLDESGNVVGYDKPSSASDRSILVDAKGDPLTFDDALRHLVQKDPDHDRLVRDKTKPGAGSKTSAEKSVSVSETADDGMSGKDRIRASLSNMKLGNRK